MATSQSTANTSTTVTWSDQSLDEQIHALELEADQTVRKIKYLKSETAIKYMEEDLLKIEQRIKQVKADHDKKVTQNPVNMSQVMDRVKYFLENLDKVLIK